jgi:hypothetical protein
MRKIVVHVQSTLNGCISTTDGTFWEPYPWGDSEQAYINKAFARLTPSSSARSCTRRSCPGGKSSPPDKCPTCPRSARPSASSPTSSLGCASGHLPYLVRTDERPVISGDLTAALRALKDRSNETAADLHRRTR